MSFVRRLLTGVALFSASLALSSPLLAQMAGGSISGTVTDPSGAVVPQARIVIRNVATDVSRAVVSNGQGFYSAPNLSPGRYQVTVSAAGFATLVEEVLLTVGGEVSVNAVLKLGDISQKVEITEQQSTVELSSSTLNATVGGQTIRELPLNGRDWAQLATLEPGVKTIGTQTAPVNGSNGRANRGWGTALTISGNRPQQNSYRLDGVTINDYAGAGPGNVLGGNVGVDAIQEFSVVTSNASAEYARTSGGVLNAVTRAGTNQFRGSAYEFLRNSALDARNYFDGPRVPPFKRNQFGATIGGPIRKNRTFFFFDYEGLRQSLSLTDLITVPSRAARTGLLTDPNTHQTRHITIDPKVSPFLAVYPLPNAGENGDTGTYSFVAKNVTDQNFYTTRIDHQFSSADSLHGTYLNDDSHTTGPDTYDILTSALISSRHTITLEETHVFTPTLLNTARFGFNRVLSRAPLGLNALSSVATDTSLGFLSGKPIGTLTIPGVSDFLGGLGSQSRNDVHYNSFQWYDDVFYTRGTHSLKFGAAVERIQANQFNTGTAANGGFTFGSLEGFLTNRPLSFTSQIPGPIYPIDLRQTVLGLYAQDDWHVRSNLTLNLGVRYEMATVPTETANRLSTLVNITNSQPRLGSPYFQNPTVKDFSPRIGLSWDPFGNGKTAVRGAFGVYDTLPLTYQFNLLTTGAVQGQATTLPAGSFPLNAFSLLTPQSSRVAYVEQHPKRSYVEQWNLNVQRQFGKNLTVQTGYTGSHGIHQPFRTQDADLVLPIQTSPYFLWPARAGTRINPNVGQINALLWQVSSSYDALQVRASERIGNRLQLQGAYTWSKAIDTGSASMTGGQFDNSLTGLPIFWPRLRRGLADFDVRHNFVLNYLFQLPLPATDNGFLAVLARGWQLGGIFQAASGQPFTVLIGGDPLGMKSSQKFDFPDRVRAAGCDSAVNPGNQMHYVKSQCFVAPASTTRLGTSGRNSVIGPGLTDFDFALLKDTHILIREGSRLQFRVELFNILNHANFNPPTGAQAQAFSFDTQNGFKPVSSFGQLTQTSTTSRQIQLGLKLFW